ncbi:MAG: hypothetical protein AAGK92_16080 [Pseudomonadota bacterium]
MTPYLTRGLILGALSLSLTGCMDTATPSMSMSETMMSRAETLAARGSITQAQLSEAFNTGVRTQSVSDTSEGADFAATCQRLKSATDSAAGLNALGADTSVTFATCAGYFS